MAANTTTAKDSIPVTRKRAARKRRPWVRRFKIFCLLAGTVLGIAACAGMIFFESKLKWADDQLNRSLAEKLNFVGANTTVITARDGTILYTSSKETRDPIESFKDVPDNVIHATLAAEDRRFFQHTGVDYVALARSAWTDLREHRTAEGGSTLTMQLVKRIYTSPEKTFGRKVDDVALAIELEKRLKKQEILLDYLNQVYYGQGAYGFKAASEVYFNKSDLSKLTVGEAALLARLVRRPSQENPFVAKKKAIDNRDDVLATELEMHWITQSQYDKGINEKVHLAPKRFAGGETIYHAPYFVRYVLDTLHKTYPDINFQDGGYTIETTLDLKLEKDAERAVREVVESNRRMRVTTGACLLMSADGEILAMVGGVDYLHHQFNAVTQGKRQPGSSFKPIVYSTALAYNVISPNDSISSGPFTYDGPGMDKPWSPKNDNGFGGPVSIRTAIALSINTAAARVCQMVGPETIVNEAHSVFGYTSQLQPVMSIALGSQAVSPMEQAQAYSIFMLHGDRATPYGITRIVGPNNDVVKAYGPDIHQNMLFANVAEQMDDYLAAVVSSGTATRARSVADARGKTGTTEDNRDAWFCGYTNNLLSICWVANEHHDPTRNPPYYYDPMPHVWGGTVATEIWIRVMHAAQDKYGKGAPQPPKEVDRSEMTTNDENDNSDSADTDKPIHPDRHSDNTDNSDNSGTDNTDNSGDNGTDTTQYGTDGSTGSTGSTGGNTDNTDNKDQGDQTTPTPPPTPPSNPGTTPGTTAELRTSRRKPAKTEYVTVEICADTGLRATIYCPETITRTFVKGTEPTRYCTKHHA